MATSNAELALERLDAVTTNLGKIYVNLDPGRLESRLTHSDDRLKYDRARGCRMIQICEAAHLAMENAAKAMAMLGGVPAQQLWIHDIAKLVDSLDDSISKDLRMLLRSAPELIEHEGYITMWRTVGAYGTPGEGRTAHEIATPAFGKAMALITCDVADYTAHTTRHYLGSQNTITELMDWSQSIRQHLTEYDITTGDPLT